MKTTEADSNYQDLEKMSLQQLLGNMNREDNTVPAAVAKALPQLE
ncbi:MAG: N-acetylmuramic acid 6-phosphate etherase, partial [Sphingobacteriia bacterium]|nr:N-acetylmuramic acid 6-phosphate etherase [Sphingobacteriia bacterium]